MNKRARNEFIWLVTGILMIFVGTAVFLAKAKITNDFLGGDAYTWWQRCLFLLLLLVGIILVIVKPHKPVPKIVAGIGALLIVVMVVANTTIILKDRISAIKWVICSVLWIFGSFICVVTLVINGRKR